MTIATVNKKERYKGWISIEEVNKIKSDVYSILNLVANKYNYKISKEDLPQIEIIPGESSEYDRSRNIIGIAEGKIGVGESYSAEIGHFLRNYSMKRIHAQPIENLEELRVEEFFDRATTIIAKKLTKGTKQENLFKEEIDYSSPEGRKRLSEIGENVRKMRREVKNYSGMDRNSQKSHIENEAVQFKSHIAYTYADQHSADEFLSLDNFYSIPNRDIENKFFHRKRSLEKLLGLFLIIIGSSFMTFSITGFSIFNQNYLNSSSGIFLIIIGIIILALYSRRK
ncbi:MAG: hypothetical protein WC781_02845 [Candidatus Pacearchaeota archaeon]|jgi:hypothetical protein